MQASRKREYATVGKDEGVNYREIAEIMTALGYDMNHSSARNHLLRIMRRFCIAYCEAQGFDISDHGIDDVCRSPGFQEAVSQLVQQIENRRRNVRSVPDMEPVKTLDSGLVKRKVYLVKSKVATGCYVHCICYAAKVHYSAGQTRAKQNDRVLVRSVTQDEIEVHVLDGPVEVWVVGEE